MSNGKYARTPAKNYRRGSKRASAVMLSLLLLLTFVIGGTLAYLNMQTGDVTNTFTPGKVTSEVQETFENNVKSNVNVKNTGNINAYLRVKLVSYRVNFDENGNDYIIGGDAPIPDFEPGAGWAEKDGYYYYTKPVAPGETPAKPLVGEPGIALEDYLYTFYGATVTEEEKKADEEAVPYGIKSGKPGGGRQVIEVMAEAIQAQGGKSENGVFTPAVTLAWGIEVDDNGNLDISAAAAGQ